jgi:hypothetical protein
MTPNSIGVDLRDHRQHRGRRPGDFQKGVYRVPRVSKIKALSTAAVHSDGVIPEIDIWRAAQLMLKRYGDQALKESAARATELTLAGDDDGAATWHRIMAAVTELANTTPPGPMH